MKRSNLLNLLFVVLGAGLVIVGIISDEVGKIPLVIASFGLGIVFTILVIELYTERHGQ